MGKAPAPGVGLGVRVDPPAKLWSLPAQWRHTDWTGPGVINTEHLHRAAAGGGGAADVVHDDDALPAGMVDITPPTTHGIGQRITGRLKERVAFWRDVLHATPTVLKWIERGYDLPFQRTKQGQVRRPPRSSARNHPGADEFAFFIDESLPELLAAGAVRVWKGASPPIIISPLNVVPKNVAGKYRLILDLRILNAFLLEYVFKMETLGKRRAMFVPGAWLISLDIVSAYYHISVRECDLTYLGFQWRGVTYVFCVLPFGLSTAPLAFTKVTKQITKYLRLQCGISLLHYLDDYLFQALKRERADQLAVFAVDVFQAAGFLVSVPKSSLTPKQVLQCLGFIINLVAFTFELIPRRVVALHQLAVKLGQMGRAGLVPNRLAAKFNGTLQSMSMVLGKAVQAFTRSTYDSINSVPWGGEFPPTATDLWEWSVWELVLSPDLTARTGVPRRWVHSVESFHHCVIETDASDDYWAAILRDKQGRIVFRLRGEYTPEQKRHSSTWREFFAFVEVLEILGPIVLSQLSVLIMTDSKSASVIYEKGRSKRASIHRLVVSLFVLMARFNIHVEVTWWRRCFGWRADELSKWVDACDWRLRRRIFLELDAAWGPHTHDRFASEANVQCRGTGVRRKALLFNALVVEEKSAALGNCYHFPWSRDSVSWVFPPVGEIGKAIHRAQTESVSGTLVVPRWEHAAWWPLLFVDGVATPFVRDWLDLGSFAACVTEDGVVQPVWLAGGDVACMAVRF